VPVDALAVFCGQGLIANVDEGDLPAAVVDQGGSVDQISDPLGLDQLRDRDDDELVGADSVRRTGVFGRGAGPEAVHVNAVVHGDDLPVADPFAHGPGVDVVGRRDHQVQAE
jgi:hypothetical protein